MSVTFEQLMDAARKADAAGDEAGAKRLLELALQAKPSDPQQAMRDRIAAAKAGTLTVSPESAARAAEADQIAQDRMTISGAGPILAGVTKFAQGVPLIGEYSDEITGFVDRATGGTGAAGDQQKAVQDAMAREYPKTSTALGVAGGIAGSVGGAGLIGRGAQALGLAAPVASMVPAGIGGRVVAGGLLGAAAGGIEGAVSGYGAGEGDSRVSEAVTRGLLGTTLGGVLGAAAPAAFAGIRAIAERVRGTDVRTIAKTFNISPDAAKALKASIEADDLAGAQRILAQAGDDAMLADAGGGFTQMLDTSMQSGGAAARIGREAVDSRAIVADERLTALLDDTLGDPQGINQSAREIAQRTSAARSQAYDIAFNTPINYADDTGRAIEQVLSRVPSSTLKSAIDEANEEMTAQGLRNLQIMAEIGDNGQVVFREMPNVRQLNEIKKALDNIARSNVDQFGRPNQAGLRNAALARQLRNALTEAVPSYGSALKLGGDKIAEDSALDLGRRLLQPGTTRETVREVMDGASVEARRAAQQGLRSQLDEMLANVKSNITNPNADINELTRLWKDMSSRANREKAALVLGQAEADRLFAALDEAGIQLQTRASVARNSATAARQAGQRSVREATDPGVVGLLKEGRGLDAARRVVQVLTGNTPQDRLAKEQGIYAELAQVLTTKRGQEAQDALAIVKRAMDGQPASSAEAARVARVITGGLALGTYQTTSQSLATRRSGTGPR